MEGCTEKALYYDIRLMDSIHSLLESHVSRTYVRRPSAERPWRGCPCCALLLVKSKQIRQHSGGSPSGCPPWWKARRLCCSASKKQANKKAQSSHLPRAFTHPISTFKGPSVGPPTLCCSASRHYGNKKAETCWPCIVGVFDRPSILLDISYLTGFPTCPAKKRVRRVMKVRGFSMMGMTVKLDTNKYCKHDRHALGGKGWHTHFPFLRRIFLLISRGFAFLNNCMDFGQIHRPHYSPRPKK